MSNSCNILYILEINKLTFCEIIIRSGRGRTIKASKREIFSKGFRGSDHRREWEGGYGAEKPFCKGVPWRIEVHEFLR